MYIGILQFIWIFAGMIFLGCAEVSAKINTLSSKECENMVVTGVITNNNPVSCDRLRRVSFKYINFEGNVGEGNIVVFDAVAEQAVGIFSELFKLRFPIQKAIVMENYQGNDELSMIDNNTSAFNGRPTTGGSSWSKHAYGVAIDINPLQNPYISFQEDGSAKIYPPASAELFVNRSNLRPGKKERAGMVENIVDVFARHGFIRWGGEWDTPIDYHHFEIGSQDFVNELLSQSPDVALQTFNRYAKDYNDCLLANKEKPETERYIICVEKVRK
ncbi:hypothetical protein NOVO_08575 [Rickettsiales bacterium Ac37b]|nr:hypothetical protein NOVO_08575 [Rickettsiales bacterium Ac37b]